MTALFTACILILAPLTTLGSECGIYSDCCDCDWGYLNTIGPTDLRYKCRCRPIDRHNLVSIAAVEAEYQKRAAEKAQKENKLLDSENERNIAIVAKGFKPLVVETPSPIPAPPEPTMLTPQTPNNNYSNFDPADFPFYIDHQLNNGDHKNHKGHGRNKHHNNGDSIYIPFQMPFQTSPPPLDNASKAVYVQQ